MRFFDSQTVEQWNSQCCIVLCGVLWCAVLCCTLLYCNCTVLYCTAPHCTVLHYSVLSLYTRKPRLPASTIAINEQSIIPDASPMHLLYPVSRTFVSILSFIGERYEKKTSEGTWLHCQDWGYREGVRGM